MALRGDTPKRIAKFLDKRENFRIGNVSGRWVTGHQSGHETARLPEFLRDQLNGHLKDKDMYVVYSYDTPIAWAIGDKKDNWFVPDVKYSATTTNHQSVVSVAILPNSPYLGYDPKPAIVEAYNLPQSVANRLKVQDR